MRIVVDGSVFLEHLTGIGRYSYQLLDAAARLKPDYEFIVLANKQLMVDFESENVHFVQISRRWLGNVYLWKLLGVGIEADRLRGDVFWSTSGVGPACIRTPVVQTIYDFVYRTHPETMSLPSRIFRMFSQPYWVKNCRRSFSISQAVAAEVELYCSTQVDDVIRPSVDESFYPRPNEEVQAIRQQYCLIDPYNLIVGTLEPRKNLEPFLREYISFAKSNSGIVLPVLAIIGGKGWKDESLLRAMADAEKLGYVKRLGYVPFEQLPALYSGSEMFFMPSLYEGFGMPILEARLCGCPVTCSNLAAMIEAGGQDSLYHAPTPEEIRNVLRDIYIEKVAYENKSSVLEWSWSAGAEQLVRLFEQAIDI